MNEYEWLVRAEEQLQISADEEWQRYKETMDSLAEYEYYPDG